ncbi:hypothetical protein [Actinomadura rubrisoli]|uniref:Uncharacterized protein n=1 Tax=Actinomadura rubrisoli TaxID=2530368 RepID=A0A4R5AA62_9ACTN|nr:hypothetical protein [Actinomadura rubrisoli]TDD67819.1 hypothetical protein E1298_38995 [Actinomadura rubrisoli]
MSNPHDFPPVEQWPMVTPPDCPLCQRPTDVVWIGPATYRDGAEVNAWHCRACRHDWPIPLTRWPVEDGPYCLTEDTSWAALAPDALGDLWTCGNGHEFVLTSGGQIILPEDAG